MPPSSFVPPHRPDRGLFGSEGNDVHGWQPMLKYPSSYCGRDGISFAFTYCHTCSQFQSASRLTFHKVFPLGRRCSSTFFRLFRVGDCSRRSPVNQISNGSSARISGSTLRNWQQRVGSLRYKVPNADSCSSTVATGSTFTKLNDHWRAILSRYSYVCPK